MEFLIAWFLLALIPALIAQKKGRSLGLWWFYGFMLFPVALVHSLIMKADAATIERQQLSQGMRKCPHCAELIKKQANVCRYCGRDM